MVLSGREVLGIAVQTAVGTPIDPTVIVPVSSGTFRASEEFEQILDQGRRGPDAMDFAAVQGVGITNVTWDGIIAENNTDGMVFGILLDNLMGANTTEETFGTSNNEYLFRLGTTKEYLTLEHVLLRGTTVDRQIPACRVTEIVIRYNAGEGALTYSVNLVGRKVIKVDDDTVGALTDNEGQIFRGWEAQVMTTGAAGTGFTADTTSRLISAEWTLRRSSSPFYGSTNSQDFSDLFLGPLEATCTMVIDYDAVTEIDQMRNKTQGTLGMLFTRGTASAASERSFGIGSTLMDWGDGPAELDNSNENVRLQISARGLYSTSNDLFSQFVSPANGVQAPTAVAQNGPVSAYIAQEVDTAY